MSTEFASDAPPPGGGDAYISDEAVRAPPTSGPAAYSPPRNFLPGRADFPTLGGTYIDPVFGTTIRRLTAELGGAFGGYTADIYNKNSWWNADADYFVHTFGDGTVKAIFTRTGAVRPLTNAGSTSGARSGAACSPIDPDAFLFASGRSLKRQSISTGTVTTLKTFGAALGDNGGSVDWIEKTGRYMALNIGGDETTGAWRIWDSVTDSLFSGTVSMGFGAGWVGITPDAEYLVINAGGMRRSFAIDTAEQTLAMTGVLIANVATGDHGDLISCTDGKSYLVSLENSDTDAWLTRFDLATGAPEPILRFPANDSRSSPNDFSAVGRGLLQDWVFLSTDIEIGHLDYSNDLTSAMDPTSSWGALQNEIFMVNVLTGQRRRLAHTRSRESYGSGNAYNYQPRVCCSWDGTKIAWVSNMGVISSPIGAVDLFTLTLPT